MPEPFGWPSIRDSYTIQRDEQGNRCYRGALRRDTDQGVIWECDHQHYARGYYSGGARWCATQEHWRRAEEARRAATPDAVARGEER